MKRVIRTRARQAQAQVTFADRPLNFALMAGVVLFVAATAIAQCAYAADREEGCHMEGNLSRDMAIQRDGGMSFDTLCKLIMTQVGQNKLDAELGGKDMAIASWVYDHRRMDPGDVAIETFGLGRMDTSTK